MATILVGPGNTSPYDFYAVVDDSFIDFSYPANETGTIFAFKTRFIYGVTEPVKMGTMYSSGWPIWTTRDYVTLGGVGLGPQTFTGLSCDVVTGDNLAIFASPNSWHEFQRYASGANTDGDVFASGSGSFSYSSTSLCIGAEGVTSDLLATVTTQAVTDIDKTTATGNGNVTSDGGSAITERGVCYCLASHGTPDTGDDKDTSAGTTGAFTTSMTDLLPYTAYHARAYATNTAGGTAYGELVDFTTLMAATYIEILTADKLTNRNAIVNGGMSVYQRGGFAAEDSFTKLLANFDGADSAVAFVAATGQIATFVGHAHIHAAQKKFGTAALDLDGTDDAVTFPASTNWQLGSADFTIEFWCYLDEAVGTARTIMSYGGTASSWAITTGRSWIIGLDTSGKIFFSSSDGDVTATTLTCNTAITTTTWTHYAVVRISGDVHIYKGGISDIDGAIATTSVPSTPTTLKIGKDGATTPYWHGNIDEIRISNGIGRYAANFTPYSVAFPRYADDKYCLDRWNLLSDGNAVVAPTQGTSATITDPSHNMTMTIETANKKFGIIQILEQKDARRFINQTASLSFKAKVSNARIGGLSAAVYSWTSTADAVTSDIVDVWGDAGTDPTLVANWTLEGAVVDFTPTTSWATYKSEAIVIDTASATNIAVFIWTDDVTMDVGDILYLTDVQLELGSVATPFEFRPYGQELALCRRHCYGIITAAAKENIALGIAASTTVAYFCIFLSVEMRAIPTLTATAADYQCDDGATAVTNVTALVIGDRDLSNQKMVSIKATATFTAFRPYFLTGDDTAGRIFLLTADL